MSRKVVVEVDTREQQPFLFPSQVVWSPERGTRQLVLVSTVRRELPFGDYRLASDPAGGVVERKKGLDELASNLLSADRARFGKAWIRFLTESRYPILVVEQAFYSTRLHLSPESGITPPDVVGAVFRMLQSAPRLMVVWAEHTRAPSLRTALGGQLVRLMLAAEWYGKKQKEVCANAGPRERIPDYSGGGGTSAPPAPTEELAEGPEGRPA